MQLEQQIHILCNPFFTHPAIWNATSFLYWIKLDKSLLLVNHNYGCLILLAQKIVAKQRSFIQLVSFNAYTFISYSIVWTFILNVLYFPWSFDIAHFLECQTAATLEQLNEIPQDPVFM